MLYRFKLSPGKKQKYASKFKGEKHTCALSGFTEYESKMVKLNGKWVIPEYIDKEYK